jgi:hypothetical protein
MSDGNHMPVVIPVRLPLLVAFITYRMRCLKLCGLLRCWFKQVCRVLHSAKRMTAVCGLHLLYLSVEPVQRNYASRAALRVHRKGTITNNLRAAPSSFGFRLPH